MILSIMLQVLIFGVVFASCLAVMQRILLARDVRRRLTEEPSQGYAAGSIVKRQTMSNPFLLWVQASTSPKDSKDGQKLRRDLALAGFETLSAPVIYVLIRFSLAIGLPLAFLLSQTLLAKPTAGFGLFFGPLVLCGLGLIAPSAFVKNRARARNEQLEQEFPDALDLMVVCVEAGLGIEASFIRVTEEIHESHPRIAEAFGRVSSELRAGRGRADALREMAERTTVDTVKSFVALLIQTDSLGTSIAQALRIYSLEMREHRLLRAEEKAMRIPVLLTIPLVACILPVIVTALLLPAGIDVARQLIPMLNGRGGS